MSTQRLEEELVEAEQKREASERRIDANIRIKESIEKMERRLGNLESGFDALTRKLSEFITQQSQLAALEQETLTKLNRYLDDWQR